MKSLSKVALFMSGSGTNVEALMRYKLSHSEAKFNPSVIVTDAPESSRAIELAKLYNLPIIALDIKNFYTQHGESSIALNTPRRCELREEWTNLLRAELKPFEIDFIVLAGFVPLSNITQDYPTINVHPADLTITINGKRAYTGLHCKPVELAILNGEKSLRSSVILAQPYTGNGANEVDSGPVLGISSAMNVDLGGHTLDELKSVYSQRLKGVVPKDILREIANNNIECLKYQGDHTVLPPVVDDFAAGRFRCEDDKLYFDNQLITTVEYDSMANRKLLPQNKMDQ